jgi:hypothetical protein
MDAMAEFEKNFLAMFMNYGPKKIINVDRDIEKIELLVKSYSGAQQQNSAFHVCAHRSYAAPLREMVATL